MATGFTEAQRGVLSSGMSPATAAALLGWSAMRVIRARAALAAQQTEKERTDAAKPAFTTIDQERAIDRPGADAVETPPSPQIPEPPAAALSRAVGAVSVQTAEITPELHARCEASAAADAASDLPRHAQRRSGCEAAIGASRVARRVRQFANPACVRVFKGVVREVGQERGSLRRWAVVRLTSGLRVKLWSGVARDGLMGVGARVELYFDAGDWRLSSDAAL